MASVCVVHGHVWHRAGKLSDAEAFDGSYLERKVLRARWGLSSPCGASLVVHGLHSWSKRCRDYLAFRLLGTKSSTIDSPALVTPVQGRWNGNLDEVWPRDGRGMRERRAE